MKHECGLIGDLLPLYSEGIACDESRRAVDEHVLECVNCKKELDALQKAHPGLPTAALPMKNISRSIRKRRRMTVMMASSLLLALAMAFGAYLTDKQYLSYEKDQLSISNKDGFLVFDIKRPDVYLEISKAASPDQPDIAQYEVSLYTRRFDAKTKVDSAIWTQTPEADKGLAGGPVPHRAIVEVADGEEVSVYYVKADEPSVLVFGKDLYPSGGYMVLPRLALAYYAMLAASGAVVLGILLLFFRRKAGINKALAILLGLPLSYLVGQLMIKGFSTHSYDSLPRDLLWILACATFLLAAWMIALFSRKYLSHHRG